MSDPTIEEFEQQLLNQLAASADIKIVSPEGKELTLREAVEQMFVKLRTIYTLYGRPRNPLQSDDLYGHVMNTRAEGLITQQLVAKIAAKNGINVDQVRSDVMNNLNQGVQNG